MFILEMDAINLLEEKDKKKIFYFTELLLKKEKYNNLRKDLEVRRKEIKQGKVLSHETIWNSLDV
jgi:hypothetical protein